MEENTITIGVMNIGSDKLCLTKRKVDLPGYDKFWLYEICFAAWNPDYRENNLGEFVLIENSQEYFSVGEDHLATLAFTVRIMREDPRKVSGLGRELKVFLRNKKVTLFWED